MKKIVFAVSAFVLVLMMKATGAIGAINASFHPGQSAERYLVLFGHSLDEKNISSFKVVINGKEYSSETKIDGNGRLYAEIPNELSPGDKMAVFAVINYKDGSSFQTSTKLYTSTSGFGTLIFAKL